MDWQHQVRHKEIETDYGEHVIYANGQEPMRLSSNKHEWEREKLYSFHAAATTALGGCLD